MPKPSGARRRRRKRRAIKGEGVHVQNALPATSEHVSWQTRALAALTDAVYEHVCGRQDHVMAIVVGYVGEPPSCDSRFMQRADGLIVDDANCAIHVVPAWNSTFQRYDFDWTVKTAVPVEEGPRRFFVAGSDVPLAFDLARGVSYVFESDGRGLRLATFDLNGLWLSTRPISDVDFDLYVHGAFSARHRRLWFAGTDGEQIFVLDPDEDDAYQHRLVALASETETPMHIRGLTADAGQGDRLYALNADKLSFMFADIATNWVLKRIAINWPDDERRPQAASDCSIAAFDNRLFLGDADGLLVAVNASSGAVERLLCSDSHPIAALAASAHGALLLAVAKVELIGTCSILVLSTDPALWDAHAQRLQCD